MRLRLLASGRRADFLPLGGEGVQIHAVADRLLGILERRLGPDATRILATPQISENGDRIDWHTPLAGTILRLTDAPPNQAAAARAAVEATRNQFAELAASLAREGNGGGIAKLLPLALTFPGDEYVFLVDGRPVISFWGFAALPAMAARGLAEPPADPIRAQMSAPVDIAERARRLRPWWLVALLALLALLLLLGWCQRRVPTTTTCTPGAPVPAKVVMALDSSASMALAMGPEAGEVLMALQQNQPGAQERLNALIERTRPEDARMAAAKQAVEALMEQLPDSARIGLVTFGQCGKPQTQEMAPDENRRRLLRHVREVEPQQGTPLAAALVTAAKLAGSGPAVIALISDGGESCGGDPCMEAQRIEAENPDLVINVIDISGLPTAGSCIAEATGGKVFTPATLNDLRVSVNKAAICANEGQLPK